MITARLKETRDSTDLSWNAAGTPLKKGMALEIHSDGMITAIREATIPVFRGEVTGVDGLIIEGNLPGARMGMRVSIIPNRSTEVPLAAEIVACDSGAFKVSLLERMTGIGPGDRIETAPLSNHISCSAKMLGRVVDPLGKPVDGRGDIADTEPFALERPAPNPLTRRPVDRQLQTGVRVIDGCLGVGEGQRMGLFAGPGLGKSTLIGMLAGQTLCDVNVICLVGERGREVGAFLRDALGDGGLSRSVVVLATADAPPMARIKALDAATAISEWFRARSQRVLLLVDSLTRVVRARRELALALGEPPTRGGFPASAFVPLPGLMERTGNGDVGSITAIYTVLTEGKGDDPVSEEARSLLDGHILLSEKRAGLGIWPAVDIVRSISRVFDDIVSDDVVAAARALKRMLAAYEDNEDLILMGAYRRGTSSDTDRALDKKSEIEAFLRQKKGEVTRLADTFDALKRLVDMD